MTIVVPDEIVEKIIIEQYTYNVYANYDVFITLNSVYDIVVPSKYKGKRILVFFHNSTEEYSKCRNIINDFPSVHLISFMYEYKEENAPIVFTVAKTFAHKYIEHVKSDYPQVITSEADNDFLIDMCGCSLYNICHLMEFCNRNQLIIKNLKRTSLGIAGDNCFIEKDVLLFIVLSMKAVGINRKLANEFIDKEKLSNYLDKHYLFCNGDYIIPNINLYLEYKDFLFIDDLKVWYILDKYVGRLIDDNDHTIIVQVNWIMEKTIRSRYVFSDELGNIIFRIEEKLHKLYRFSSNDALLKLEALCKQYFKTDEERYINILINEAILYDDIEKFEVAKEKFLQAIQLCNDKYSDIYIYVIDEYSRLLQKVGLYQEALDKLFKVVKYYKLQNSIYKIRNVKNRIGLNLCFVGHVKKAIYYLEQLFYYDFNGNINKDNVLSCEVANNLSICYMEIGDFDSALKLQDELYGIYLDVEKAPINYATDILQNKGSVYLYMQEYKDAVLCFEQALKDEKNPVSKELILENFLYAKTFYDKDFSESLPFFENQTKNSTVNETVKMLAELYFEGKFYNDSAILCKKSLKKINYKENRLLFLSLDIIWIKSMMKLKKITLIQRIKAMLRLYKYRRFICKNIGDESPYYKALSQCMAMLAQWE